MQNDPSLDDLQTRLGVHFKDISLLERALRHRSAAIDSDHLSNERMEFLGDSVVGLVVCETLYRLFPDSSEGELAKCKAYIVSESSLAAAAIQVGLDAFVMMSAGEDSSGGRKRRSILSDAFEAIIGAIYLDCGITTARRVVRRLLKQFVLQSTRDKHRGDYKSSLQERTQAIYRLAPLYRVVEEIGSEHDKTFAVQAILLEEVIGAGNGKTKKEAEQAAAHDALDHLPAKAITEPNRSVDNRESVSIPATLAVPATID